MKTQPIKASFDALLNAAKPSVKKVVKHAKDNPGIYATAGVGAYVGGKLISDLNADTVNIGYSKEEIIPDTAGAGIGRPLGYKLATDTKNEPGIFQRLHDKIHDAVSVNPNNAPEWLDNTKPYMVTKSGKLVTDDYGVLINPWFNGTPEEIIEKAASTPGFIKTSMDEFLAKGVMDPAAGGFAPDFQGGGFINIGDLNLDDASEHIIDVMREVLSNLS